MRALSIAAFDELVLAEVDLLLQLYCNQIWFLSVRMPTVDLEFVVAQAPEQSVIRDHKSWLGR